nr:hypothetical protein [uncultured Mediterranean phage uvMED]
MKRHVIHQPIYHLKLEEHKVIKDKLIKLLTSDVDKLESYRKNDNDLDNMTMLDFNYSEDMSRTWIKFFKPLWDKKILELSEESGFSSICKLQMWFQQYHKPGDGHGWHQHGQNFTGVYYLEFGKTSPRTELIDPFTHQIIRINVDEGDLIFFPSHICHRSPTISDFTRKTIISWNFEAYGPSDNYKIKKSLPNKIKDLLTFQPN